MYKRTIRKRQGIGWSVSIPITTNNQPLSLEGRSISVEVRMPDGTRKEVKGVTLRGHIIQFYFGIDMQPYLGVYSIIVYENKGKLNQNICDRDYFVELVESTTIADEYEGDKQMLPCGNLNSSETFVVHVEAPVITASGSESDTARVVSIENSEATTDGATIYYTTDGSDPKTRGFRYTEPFEVSKNTTIKAIAMLYDDASDVAEMLVKVTVRELESLRVYSDPTFAPTYGTISESGGSVSVQNIAFKQTVEKHFSDGTHTVTETTADEKATATYTYTLKNQLTGTTIDAAGKVTYNTANSSTLVQKVADVEIVLTANGKTATATVSVKQNKSSYQVIYGSSAGLISSVPTSPSKTLTNGMEIKIETDFADKKKCHYIAVKKSSGAYIGKWLDVDNDDITDMILESSIGEYNVYYLLSTSYISNTSKVTISI